MVEQCPTNATIFQERSAKKTCDLYPSCSGIPLVYHCVSYKEGLAEVCAPRDQITGMFKEKKNIVRQIIIIATTKHVAKDNAL